MGSGSNDSLSQTNPTPMTPETYLRFECVDAAGHAAWSNPLYPEA